MQIRVDGSRITADGNVVVGGNHDFAKLTFTFDHSWDKFIKFAQFTQRGATRNVMLVDNRCDVPADLRPGPFYLDVAGVTPNSDDRATTAYLTLHLQGGPVLAPPPGSVPPGPPLPPPPEMPRYTDLYDELNQRIHDACIKGGRILLDPSLSKKDMAAEANAVGVALELIRQTVAGGDRELGDRLHAVEEGNNTQNAMLNSLQRQMDGAESKADEAVQKADKAEGMADAVSDLQTMQQEHAAQLSSQQTSLEELQRRTEVTANIQNGLKNQVAENRSAVTTLRGETDRHAEALSELTLQMAAVSNSLNASMPLANRVAANESALVSLRAGLQDVQDRAEANGQGIAGLRTDVQALQESDTRRAAALEGVKTDLQNAQTALRGEIQTVAGSVQEVREGLEALKNGVSSLSSGHQNVGDSVSLSRRRLDLLEAAQKKLDNDLRTQLDDIRDAERRITAVEKVADDGKDKVEDHEGRIESAEDDLRLLKARFSSWEATTIPDLQAADRVLGKKADFLKDRLDHAEETLETVQSEHRGMIKRMEAMTADHDEIKSQVKDAVDMAKATRTLVSHISSQDVNGRLYQCEATLQETRNTVSQTEANLRRDLDGLRQRLLQLEGASGSHEDADVHASDVRALQAAISKLETRLQGLEDNQADKDALALVQGTLREYARDVDRLKAAVGVLEEKAGANSEDIQRLLNGFRELKDGNDGRENVIRKLLADMETLRTSVASVREHSISGDEALSERMLGVERNLQVLQDSLGSIRRSYVPVRQGDGEAGRVLVVNPGGDVTTQPPKGLIVTSDTGFKQFFISVNDSGQLQVSEIL